MCRTLYSLCIAVHVQPKLGARSQLIGPLCIGIHQDHQALGEMVCAKMQNEVNLSGAHAMVMVVRLWQDGILQLSMGKDNMCVTSCPCLWTFCCAYGVHASPFLAMCRTLYSLCIAMHVQSKLGARSQLIGPLCIGIHQDHQALWEMVCAKMQNEVNLSGAHAMVMVVRLWQDGILQLSMGKDNMCVTSCPCLWTFCCAYGVHASPFPAMCRTLYSLCIAVHVQSKLGACSQLIGPLCIGIHQDHQALWEMVCAKMQNEVNLSGAHAMVMVVRLWQDGILRLSMGKDNRCVTSCPCLWTFCCAYGVHASPFLAMCRTLYSLCIAMHVQSKLGARSQLIGPLCIGIHQDHQALWEMVCVCQDAERGQLIRCSCHGHGGKVVARRDTTALHG